MMPEENLGPLLVFKCKNGAKQNKIQKQRTMTQGSETSSTLTILSEKSGNRKELPDVR